MKIIVDAMGGDNAPVSNVRGALAAVRELGVEVIHFINTPLIVCI